MPIPLGILDFPSGGVGAFDWLETTEVTSPASTISFTGLSSTYSDYTHLQVRAVVKPTVARSLSMTFNGVTSTAYSWRTVRGDGSAVSAQSATSRSNLQVGEPVGTTFSANLYGAYVLDVHDFGSSNKATTIRGILGSNDTPDMVESWSGLYYASTAAIDEMEFYFNGSTFTGGSRISLYGVK